MTRQQLFENIKRKQSFLCVGLGTDMKKVPQHLVERGEREADFDVLFEFNKAIIDATAPYCIAYKPNLAFYEAHGVKGWMAFEKTVRYIREQHPDQFIIADAKRGDIGNTSKLYARTFFEEMDVEANSLWTATTQADWLTLSPTHAEGSCRLTVTAAANDWIEKRETTIQLSSAKGVRRMITVQQLGGDIPIPDNADNERPQFARRKKP